MPPMVQLLNAQGEKVANQDNPHTGAGRPTDTWSGGQIVKDTAALPIPPTLVPGTYTLIAGLYMFEAGKITSLEPTCASAGRFSPSFTLGTVVVKIGPSLISVQAPTFIPHECSTPSLNAYKAPKPGTDAPTFGIITEYEHTAGRP